MIEKKEIDAKAQEYKISQQQVERDYVFGWLLKAIFTESSLGERLVLKGGSALRKGYLAETRYSKDLDFSMEDSLDPDYFKNELITISNYVSKRTGVVFHTERTDVHNKSLPTDLPQDVIEASVIFKGFYGEEKIDLKAKMDVTQFERLLLPVQIKQLIHPYSDSSACRAEIKCHKAEEILASKFVCVLRRTRAGDLYDLAKTVIFENPYGIDRLELIRTFIQKSIYPSNHEQAKKDLLARDLEEFRDSWNGFAVPFSAILEFDTVIARFPNMISELFSLLAPVARTIGGFGTSAFGAMGFGGSFSGSVREVLIRAGRSLRLVRLVYNGYARLVEPYSMEYYVRKRDGVGNEYFYGWDRTGGSSGEVGIKSFFCNEIQRAEMTDESFVPRFPVEL